MTGELLFVTDVIQLVGQVKQMFIFRYLQDIQEFGFWLDLVACLGAVWEILVDTLVVLHYLCGGLCHTLYSRGT